MVLLEDALGGEPPALPGAGGGHAVGVKRVDVPPRWQHVRPVGRRRRHAVTHECGYDSAGYGTRDGV